MNSSRGSRSEREQMKGRHAPSRVASGRVLAAMAILSSLATFRVARGEGGSAHAQETEVQVAVAANFAIPMRQIASQFTAETGNRVVVIVGGTGKLRAQIQNGAPVDVFLAADAQTPANLEDAGLGVPGTRFTYAIGKLGLWSPRPGYVDGAGEVLKRGAFKHLAIANPKLAPYGAAAMEVLTRLGLLAAVRAKLVEGEDIAQAREFVASGNAELGFIAASQRFVGVGVGVVDGGTAPPTDSFWLVPANLYAPLRQDALCLRRAQHNPAALAFLRFLRGAKARSTIRAFGYGLDDAR
jgi:molybdate transport system substrate-binding protein